VIELRPRQLATIEGIGGLKHSIDISLTTSSKQPRTRTTTTTRTIRGRRNHDKKDLAAESFADIQLSFRGTGGTPMILFAGPQRASGKILRVTEFQVDFVHRAFHCRKYFRRTSLLN